MTQKKSLDIFGLTYLEFDNMTLNDFRQFYRKLAKQNHPDLFPEDEKDKQTEIFQDINSANDYLLKIKQESEKNPKPESKKAQEKEVSQEELKRNLFKKRKQELKEKIISYSNTYDYEPINLGCQKYLKYIETIENFDDLDTFEVAFQRSILKLVKEYEKKQKEAEEEKIKKENREKKILDKKQELKDLIEDYLKKYDYKELKTLCNEYLKKMDDNQSIFSVNSLKNTFEREVLNIINSYATKREKEKEEKELQKEKTKFLEEINLYCAMNKLNYVIKETCDNYIILLKTTRSISDLKRLRNSFLDYQKYENKKIKKEKIKVEFNDLKSQIYAIKSRYLVSNNKSHIKIIEVCNQYLTKIKNLSSFNYVDIDENFSVSDLKNEFFKEINRISKETNQNYSKKSMMGYFITKARSKLSYDSNTKKIVLETIEFILEKLEFKQVSEVLRDLMLIEFKNRDDDYQVLKKYMPDEEFRVDLENVRFVYATYHLGYYYVRESSNQEGMLIPLNEFFKKYITLEDFFKKAIYTGNREVYQTKYKSNRKIADWGLQKVIYLYNNNLALFYDGPAKKFSLEKKIGYYYDYDDKYILDFDLKLKSKNYCMEVLTNQLNEEFEFDVNRKK